MTLNWSNERYIRFYTRITPDMTAWPWQARAIWPWLLAIADRSGVIGVRSGLPALAGALHQPLDVVEVGIPALLADGCLQEVVGGFAIPNYIEAQSAIMSASFRQAESRANRRLKKLLDNDADADVEYAASLPVTERHAVSRSVTPGHEVSRAVGKCHSDPIRADPSRSESDSARKPRAPREAKVKRPQTQLPASWGPNESATARARASGLDLAREVERFRNHAEQTGRTCVSWDAAFSNWLLKAEELSQSPGRSGPPSAPVVNPRSQSKLLSALRKETES